MEMENLRKEYEQRLQVAVETHRAERAGLEGRVGEMAEKCRVLDEEVKDGRRKREELKQAQARYMYMYMYMCVYTCTCLYQYKYMYNYMKSTKVQSMYMYT